MKIKAFTILEIVISMAVMAIIITMVYLVYIFFTKNTSEYASMLTENFEMELFYSLLKEDFYKSDKVLVQEDNGFLVVYYDQSEVSYYSKAGFLFREIQNKKDSIPLGYLEVNTLFEKPMQGTENLVQSVSINSELLQQGVPLFVFKEYPSNYLRTRE
ncbi:MAG: hypothetical protein CMC74_02805 [Flavobacteriaceae bacterium]|nr:hypothetical protein [Flavobacteriaceae bacterium]|tara:strand:- start:66047 stop:66520 length:474 start_codon:yes stop_codon:yes gene_type:complete